MKSAAQIQSLRQERRAHQRARFGMLAALLALLGLTALVVKCQESLLP